PVGCEVANDNAGLGFFAERANRFPQESGFARTGRRQDVQDQKSARAKKAAVALGEPIVLSEDSLAQLDDAAGFCATCVLQVVVVSGMRVGMRMGVGMRLLVTLSMMMTWTMFVLVLMSMFVFMLVVVVMVMMIFTMF